MTNTLIDGKHEAIFFLLRMCHVMYGVTQESKCNIYWSKYMTDWTSTANRCIERV